MNRHTLTRVLTRSSFVQGPRARPKVVEAGGQPMAALARVGTDAAARWIISTDTRRWNFLRIPAGCSEDLAGAIATVQALPRGWSTTTGFGIDPTHLVAPAWRPGKVIGIAGNYRRHAV